jgi:hypothetical protein
VENEPRERQPRTSITGQNREFFLSSIRKPTDRWRKRSLLTGNGLLLQTAIQQELVNMKINIHRELQHEKFWLKHDLEMIKVSTHNSRSNMHLFTPTHCGVDIMPPVCPYSHHYSVWLAFSYQ